MTAAGYENEAGQLTRDTMQRIDCAFADVSEELAAAMNVNGPMKSLHEGLSVIQEEVHELMLEVYKNPRKHPDRTAKARKEAVQVAAMAIRFLIDVAVEEPCESAT